jgi:hypothetical protein
LHLNWHGAKPIAEKIVGRLAAASGRRDIQWKADHQFHRRTLAGGSENRFLSTLRPVTEVVEELEKSHRIGAEEPDGAWNVLTPLTSGDYRFAFDYEFISKPQTCGHKLPGTVVHGNSFTDLWWGLGLHKYFCAIRFTRFTQPVSRLSQAVDAMPEGTKFFIFQFFEPHVLGMVGRMPPSRK